MLLLHQLLLLLLLAATPTHLGPSSSSCPQHHFPCSSLSRCLPPFQVLYDREDRYLEKILCTCQFGPNCCETPSSKISPFKVSIFWGVRPYTIFHLTLKPEIRTEIWSAVWVPSAAAIRSRCTTVYRPPESPLAASRAPQPRERFSPLPVQPPPADAGWPGVECPHHAAATPLPSRPILRGNTARGS